MIEISATEVHVWRLPLQHLPPDELATVAANLPRGEQRRLDPVGDFARRSALIQSRAGLRQVLARYLPGHDRDVKIRQLTGSRPTLDTGTGAIHFSLSSSGAMTVIGVSGEASIGIDIEKVDSDFHWRPIAERFFAADEIKLLREMPRSGATEAFFKCWVSKEAYLKGLGLGLRAPTKSFSVCPNPDFPPTIRRPVKGTEWDRVWTLRKLEVPVGYCSVLASNGFITALRYMH